MTNLVGQDEPLTVMVGHLRRCVFGVGRTRSGLSGRWPTESIAATETEKKEVKR